MLSPRPTTWASPKPEWRREFKIAPIDQEFIWKSKECRVGQEGCKDARMTLHGQEVLGSRKDAEWSGGRRATKIAQEIDAVFEVKRHRVARGVISGQDGTELPKGIGHETVDSSREGAEWSGLGGRRVVRKLRSQEGA